MVGLKIYIISLTKSKRRPFQEKQFDFLGLDYEFFDAISSDNIANDTFIKKSSDWERRIKPSELACYMSHSRLWEKISRDNYPAVILEDDAYISNNLKKLLPIFVKLKEIDLLNFENRCRKKIVSKSSKEIKDGYRILRLLHDTTGASGYLLWPSGARKLLNFEKKAGIALADAQIFRCKNLINYQVEPAIVVQLDVAKNYNLLESVDLSLTKSSVSSKERGKNSIKFRLRRLRSQLKLGLKQIKLLIFSERRYLKTSDKKTYLN